MSKLIQRTIGKELKNGPVTIRYLEEQLILATLKFTGNHISNTAKSMGISSRMLFNKRRRMGIANRRCKIKSIPAGKNLPNNSTKTAKTYKVGKYD